MASVVGQEADVTVEGTSLLPVLRANAPGYRTALIQNGAETRPWGCRGVRTRRYSFVRYAADRHVLLFDRKKDPYELRNVAGDAEYAAVRARLEARFLALRECAGATCRAASR